MLPRRVKFQCWWMGSLTCNPGLHSVCGGKRGYVGISMQADMPRIKVKSWYPITEAATWHEKGSTLIMQVSHHGKGWGGDHEKNPPIILPFLVPLSNRLIKSTVMQGSYKIKQGGGRCVSSKQVRQGFFRGRALWSTPSQLVSLEHTARRAGPKKPGRRVTTLPSAVFLWDGRSMTGLLQHFNLTFSFSR